MEPLWTEAVHTGTQEREFNMANELKGSGSPAEPWEIHTIEDWNTFAANVTGGENDYAGQTVRLMASLSGVNWMAGNGEHPFRGVFDGNGNALELNQSADWDNCAPFGSLADAVIRNLNVTGTIATSRQFAGSIAAHTTGHTEIANCVSTVRIIANNSGDGTHGGFVAVNSGALRFTGCCFRGRLLGEGSHSNGGFVGWNNGGCAIQYTECLFAPAEVTMNAWDSCTYNRNGGFDMNHAGYTQPFGEAQGEPVFERLPEEGAPEPVRTANTYRVYFDGNAGEAVGAMAPQSFTWDDDARPLAENAFTRPGYAFLGWNTAPDGAGTSYGEGERVRNLTDAPDGAVTLYAQWGMESYAISLPAAEHGSVAAQVDGEIAETAYMGQIVALAVTPDAGYEMGDLCVRCGGDEVEIHDFSFVMPAGDVTVSAKFLRVPEVDDGTVPCVPSPEPVEICESGLLIATLISESDAVLKLTWTEVSGAAGYDVFFRKGRKKGALPPIAAIDGGDMTGCLIDGLKKHTHYRARVRAWALNGEGERMTLNVSPEVCACTGAKSTVNPDGLKLKPSALVLQPGEAAKLKASVKKPKKGKLAEHAARLRYFTDDPSVATVTARGKVKAVGVGSCRVWVLTSNGICGIATIRVK